MLFPMLLNKAYALDLAEAVKCGKDGSAKSLRRNLGVSAEVVGGACGVAGSTITRWENGSRRPTGEAAVTWIRLLRRLGSGCDAQKRDLIVAETEPK
jgi:DNA-binding transcriptional regulator YiaG